MPLKPPFYEQETPDSCVPACLRMVLASFGIEIPESELRTLCDCTFSGTDALKAVDVARQLGFTRTGKYTLSTEELRTLIADGYHPIVFVDLRPIDGLRDIHALVVIDVGQQEMIVLDPLKGERVLPSQVFNAAWAMRHNLAIVVAR